MPLIPYTLQWSVCTYKNRRKVWSDHYEPILVEVDDAVAAFLEEDDKAEQRYIWKTKKQRRDAKVFPIYLDEVGITDDGDEYYVNDKYEDIYNPENRDPLSIVIQDEEAYELNLEYSSTMTKKQYEVFRLYNQGYNNTEVAGMLGIDESSVRERLYMSFRSAVSAYLIHSNRELFNALHNEFKSHPENADLPKHKFNEYLGVLFINRLSFFRRDQMELVNFVLETDYDAAIKKYFWDFMSKPPKPPV